MGRNTCWSCGASYDGANCPTCILRKQAEKNAEQATRDQEAATAANQRALEEQTREITEALERANQAAEEQAYETQMAIARAAEDHKQATANAWRLQSRSKSEQAGRLKDSGMLSEALELALQAIRQDPGNLDGFAVAADILEMQGNHGAARTYIQKQIQLLSHSEHCTNPRNFLNVLKQSGSDEELRFLAAFAVESNVDYWDWRATLFERVPEYIVLKLSGWEGFRAAIAVQNWLLRTSGFTLPILTSTRKLVLEAASSSQGVDPIRSELECLARRISGEDQSQDSRMLKSAATRRPLAALVLADEIYSLLGNTSRVVSDFLQQLKAANRDKLEEDLSDLRKLSANSDFDPDAFPRVQRAVAEKYATMQQEIQAQLLGSVKAAVEAKPKDTHGCLAAGAAFCVLILAAVWVPLQFSHQWIRHGTEPQTNFGALFGAILFGVAAKSIEKSYRYYQCIRDGVGQAVTQNNKRFDDLGLPNMQAPALNVHPPRMSILVFAVLFCAYLMLWRYSMSYSIYGDNGATPNQGGMVASTLKPKSNSTRTQPRIDAVSPVFPRQNQTIVLSGSGFGNQAPYLGDSDFLQLNDQTRNWNGGWYRDPGTDKVGLKVTSWTDKRIVIEGFTGVYGSGQNSLNEGDTIHFRVWNPQTFQGPAVSTSVVSAAK